MLSEFYTHYYEFHLDPMNACWIYRYDLLEYDDSGFPVWRKQSKKFLRRV